MPGIEFSHHARDMLDERRIAEEWVWRTLQAPERTEAGADGNTHYISAIPERGGRFLRVAANRRTTPERIVTVYFDRRLRRRP